MLSVESLTPPVETALFCKEENLSTSVGPQGSTADEVETKGDVGEKATTHTSDIDPGPVSKLVSAGTETAKEENAVKTRFSMLTDGKSAYLFVTTSRARTVLVVRSYRRRKVSVSGKTKVEEGEEKGKDSRIPRSKQRASRWHWLR
jgi:hypothetical protein